MLAIFAAFSTSATLNGVDISNYQASLNVGSIAAEFVIIKATEGTGYVNPSCDTHYQQAIKAGKKVGVYHFARNDAGHSATSEADYFVKNIKGYIKTAILVLDWEASTANVAWAKEWLDSVHSQTGVHPVIYMSQSVVQERDWASVANHGLWVARWGSGSKQCPTISGVSPPTIKYWSFDAIHISLISEFWNRQGLKSMLSNLNSNLNWNLNSRYVS
jgi:GH25 family lysozyme M1 (1,4-beta-N-acetylmuramidase)